MGGETKLLKFSEGVTTTAPTPATTQIGNLVTYASTTAFLTAKGAAVARGDIFFNSAETSINFYEPNKWRNLYLEKLPLTLTSAYTALVDDINIQGSAVAGEFTVMLLDPTSYPTKRLFLMNVGANRSIEFKAASSGQFLWDKGLTSSIYLSGRQHASLRSDGTYWLIENYNPLIGYIQDRKPPATDGGSCLGASPQTRVLNSISGDSTNFLELPSGQPNRMQIERGHVDIEASAPAYVCGRHQLMWVNASASTIDYCGQSAAADNSDATQTSAFLSISISSDNSKLYELWHHTDVARATDGLGLDQGTAGNPNDYVVYANIKAIKRL